MAIGGMNPETKKRGSRIGVAVILAVLTMLASGCASMRPQADLAHAGYALSAAADVQSTQRALATGATEVNPLLGADPSTVKTVGLKAAGFFALRSIESTWESKLGRNLKWYEKILLWGIPIGLQSWAATHNSRVARR